MLRSCYPGLPRVLVSDNCTERGTVTNSDAAAADDDQLVEVIVDASGAVIVPDSAEVVDELYERVKDRGYVTTGEIFAALPKLEPETQELADI